MKDLTPPSPEYGGPEFQVVEKAAVAGDATLNEQLAGDYRLADLPARITAEGQRLFFQSDLFGANRSELFPESALAFFMTAQEMSIRFERNGDGAVIGFSLLRDANTYSAARI